MNCRLNLHELKADAFINCPAGMNCRRCPHEGVGAADLLNIVRFADTFMSRRLNSWRSQFMTLSIHAIEDCNSFPSAFCLLPLIQTSSRGETMNTPTIIVLVIVAAVFAAVLTCELTKKKRGKPSCSCGCGGCAFKDTCHTKTSTD